MNYITFKSRYERQGIPVFLDNGKKRFEAFDRHTLLVAEDDIALKEVIEGIMKRETEYKLQRTIFTPEEYTEFANPEMAFLEHKTKGKIPLKTVYEMIDFAFEKGFGKIEPPKDEIKVNKVKVEQGTKFTGHQEKENK